MKNSARQWHRFVTGAVRTGFEPQTAVTFQTWHESTVDSGPVALSKTHPTQRLKTGAVNVRQKENPGRAEFFVLPIAKPGSLW